MTFMFRVKITIMPNIYIPVQTTHYMGKAFSLLFFHLLVFLLLLFSLSLSLWDLLEPRTMPKAF
jgi:hypothetical protein